MEENAPRAKKPSRKKKKKGFFSKMVDTIKSAVEDVKNVNFKLGDNEVELDFENESYQLKKTRQSQPSDAGSSSDDHKV